MFRLYRHFAVTFLWILIAQVLDPMVVTAHAQTYEGRTCGAITDADNRDLLAYIPAGIVGVDPSTNCGAEAAAFGNGPDFYTNVGNLAADEILPVNYLNNTGGACVVPAGANQITCGYGLYFGSGLRVTSSGGLSESTIGVATQLWNPVVGASSNQSFEVVFEVIATGAKFTFTLSNTGTTLNSFTISIFTATTSSTSAQQQASGNLVQNRNNNLQNLQPNIGGFIDGTFANGGGDLGQFALRGNEVGFNMSFASSLGRVWSSKAKNEASVRRQIALDRSNNALAGSSQTSAFLYGQSVPNNADGVTQTSATIKKTDGESSDTAAFEPNPVENDYGSTAGAQEVANTSQLDQARERGYDMWVQVYGAKAHAGNSDSTLWVGYAGAHGFVNDNLIVGGLVQLDWVDESNDTAGSSADGFGWMVGPYIAAKLPDQNLFFDARVAYGRSDNDITLTTSTGSFQTERWLVSAKVSGLLEQGEIEIRPAVGVSYFEETQESYTDSTNTAIGSQTYTQGEVRFGPTFAKTYYQNDGTTLKPRIGINGVWNFSVDNGASTTAVLDNGDLRARLDVGLTILSAESWNVDLSGFYDGIGINNYYAYGGKARLTVPLN